MKLHTIISGGQSGVDFAALVAAKQCNLKTGGYAPLGYQTENGPRPTLGTIYNLIELTTPDYNDRTKRNIDFADATLCLYYNCRSLGTKFTIDYCKIQNKSCLRVNLLNPDVYTPKQVIDWISRKDISILNVAGNRESKASGIYKTSLIYLIEVFEQCVAIKKRDAASGN